MNQVLQECDLQWFAGVLARDPAATVAAVDAHLDELPPHAILCASTGAMRMVELADIADTQEDADLIEAAVIAAFAVQSAMSRACAGIA